MAHHSLFNTCPEITDNKKGANKFVNKQISNDGMTLDFFIVNNDHFYH